MFPADYIAEGADQTRGWFYTLHVISTIVFDYLLQNVISNGLVWIKMVKKCLNDLETVLILLK